MRIKNIIFIILSAFFISGCAAVFQGYEETMKKYDAMHDKNSCDTEFIDKKIKDGDDAILWNELGGSLARNCKDYSKSNEYFDNAETLYKQEVDLENIASAAVKSLSSIATNENIVNYRGNTYESIMINVYKGLNFMSLNDFKNARVEFNRALDRQRRAKDEFAGEIKREQDELLKEDAKNLSIAKNTKTTNFISDKYSSGVFAGFRAYPDFVNPFATYMSALFFIADKDYLKARDLLKESVAMQPHNENIRDDFNLVERILAGGGKDSYLWLIYENGKAIAKDEFRLDIPLFLVSDQISYVGIALPTLSERESSYDFLKIGDKRTSVIADMDRVVKTEFKIKLPMIITKAVLRTVSKAVAQKQADDKNIYAGIAMALFNVATNRADTRSWGSLPKNFQILRVKNEGEKFEISTPDKGVVQSLSLPKDKNAIIYVKSSVSGYHISHQILF